MTDADLLADLAGMLDRLDPVPTRVHRAAVAAGAFLGARWDWLALTPTPAAAVRGEARIWRSAACVIELSDHLSGLLAIPVTRVELHSGEGVVEVPVDVVGGFSARVSGRVRLVLHRDGDVPLVSEWLS
ncbi:hypothetical protein [Alloactinosynnema sp. L-07]|uniref:hypothetical protein n=1 Tax=Alloactinosynnema sp. L-07 TaxID=1653480 RepID=UPI00065F0996|nr:hypothetical protein [Alloactinosynnema sp. L-07]CRK60297.1 hypothetical protein [Alloactinosynnema sp. L-07]